MCLGVGVTGPVLGDPAGVPGSGTEHSQRVIPPETPNLVAQDAWLWANPRPLCTFMAGGEESLEEAAGPGSVLCCPGLLNTIPVRLWLPAPLQTPACVFLHSWASLQRCARFPEGVNGGSVHSGGGE